MGCRAPEPESNEVNQGHFGAFADIMLMRSCGRANELIRIAEGRTTVKKVRARNANEMKKSRQRRPSRDGQSKPGKKSKAQGEDKKPKA
jgi:hypothetical protein